MGLESKVVLVTGASRGLGRALALRLGEARAKVVVCARDNASLAETVAMVAAKGAMVLGVRTDVTDPQQVAALFQVIDNEHGVIDVVINNAGSGLFRPIEEVTDEDLDRVLAVNLKGTYYCCREAIRRMKTQRHGHIVNVISTSGLLGRVNETAYVAAKFGVTGLSESLKLEGKPYGLRVTAFFPGGMSTPFWDEPSAADRREQAQSYMKPQAVADVLVNAISAPAELLVDSLTVKRW